jgi:hypothetical protein
VERDVNGHADLRFAIYDCRFELLLLLLLLNHDLVFKIVELLKNVGIEQGAADVVEFALQPVKIIVQAGFKDFLNGVELKFRDKPTGEFFSVVRELSLRYARDVSQSAIQFSDAELDRAGKIFAE